MAGDPPPYRTSFTRRDAIGLGAAAAVATGLPSGARAAAFVSRRPPPAMRRFVSPAVEAELTRVKARIGHPKLAWMFENCFPNTLDTTVFTAEIDGRPDTFIITGDIDAMWLRDSSAQVQPYIHLARGDPALRTLFRGLIGRQARSILIDSYANAFMRDPAAKTNLSWALNDETDMKPGVAERKWEIDSLCHTLRLAANYWEATRDPAPFDAEWAAGVRRVVATFREQQRKQGPGPYRFRRKSDTPNETLALGGGGAPARPVGLIHSGFRPSDDACLFPLFIPANLFAVSQLRRIARVVDETRRDAVLARDCQALAAEVDGALKRYGRMRDAAGEDIWAYEVDGFGNAYFMDDANLPSLSGLAYLGVVDRDDALFRRTAARAWSSDNPYFFEGKAATGIGSPHIGRDTIWPMSLIVRALTSDDDATIRQCLDALVATDAGTGFIHESFDKDDAAKFTRQWFAWANGLFGELVLDLARRKPLLLAA